MHTSDSSPVTDPPSIDIIPVFDVKNTARFMRPEQPVDFLWMSRIGMVDYQGTVGSKQAYQDSIRFFVSYGKLVEEVKHQTLMGKPDSEIDQFLDPILGEFDKIFISPDSLMEINISSPERIAFRTAPTVSAKLGALSKINDTLVGTFRENAKASNSFLSVYQKTMFADDLKVLSSGKDSDEYKKLVSDSDAFFRGVLSDITPGRDRASAMDATPAGRGRAGAMDDTPSGRGRRLDAYTALLDRLGVAEGRLVSAPVATPSAPAPPTPAPPVADNPRIGSGASPSDPLAPASPLAPDLPPVVDPNLEPEVPEVPEVDYDPLDLPGEGG